MKQLAHFRLLYGVVFVLTTCLMISGVMYRLKGEQKQSFYQRLSDILASELIADRSEIQQNKQYIRKLEGRLDAQEKNADLEQQVEALRALLSDTSPHSKDYQVVYYSVDYDSIYTRIAIEREAHQEALARLRECESKLRKCEAKYREQTSKFVREN